MKIWLRVLIDAVIVIVVLTIILGWRAIMPVRMSIYLFPSDIGLPYENIVLKTNDGKSLKGWFIPSKTGKGVIICLHGYPANKSDILPVVSFLYPDFSLLLFDFRAHGESEGKITYFGLKEFMDVKAAMDFIKSRERTKDNRIGIWGYSLGGAVGIIASAKYKGIDAIVTDSAFANFPEMVTHYYKNLGPLKYLFSALSRLLGRYILGADFIENSPEYFVDKITSPILIIHSVEDDFVPYAHAERLFSKAPQPKELWKVEGAHTGLDRAFTGEYQDRVLSFFKKYLEE
ncbi:MAG: alpha/beta fold hydrolase [Candidatus Omnitrophica bacterium]|nr:alpha/beta fold hydrolase [Candidatus Omnitrophota bacterium]